MRQLGGKALRVRLAHTGHQRGAAAGVQEEQAGARHALQRRLHDVAARKEPQRDGAALRETVGRAEASDGCRPHARRTKPAAAPARRSTPQATAEIPPASGVKKFFQNGRHSIAPSAAHQPLTMAAPCRGTENSIDLPFRRNREPPVRGYFTSARFQLCASSWNAVFLASTTTLSFTRICVLPRGRSAHRPA